VSPILARSTSLFDGENVASLLVKDFLCGAWLSHVLGVGQLANEKRGVAILRLEVWSV
jgi:hypothetical protein